MLMAMAKTQKTENPTSECLLLTLVDIFHVLQYNTFRSNSSGCFCVKSQMNKILFVTPSQKKFFLIKEMYLGLRVLLGCPWSWWIITIYKAPIFFWYQLLWTTSGPQKFSKIRVLKVNYFHLPKKKNTSNWNHGLILMLLLFFINKIQNLYQFSEKNYLKLKSWFNFNAIIVFYQ